MPTLYKRTFVFQSWHGKAEVLVGATETFIYVTYDSATTFRITHSIKAFHQMVNLVQDAMEDAGFHIPNLERFLFIMLTHNRFAFEVSVYKLPHPTETE